MLGLVPMEFFSRCIPESLLYICMSYLFARKKVNKKSYFISSMFFAIVSYSVRKLPIHFGVHTIIIMLMYIILNVSINKIPIDKSVSSVLIGMILLSVCEWMNLFILNDYLKVDIQTVVSHPLTKDLYMMPSLVLFACFIMLIHMYIKIKKRIQKNVFN